jgi:hypothetical protein
MNRKIKEAKELLGKLSLDELSEVLKDEILISKEVQETLNISQQRLSAMKGKLKPIKRGVYLRRMVLLRQQEQEELREKYLHTEEYKK